MSDPKRHHYIPQFFQRKWLNNNCLNEKRQPLLLSVKENKWLTSEDLKRKLMEMHLYSMPNIKPEDPEYLEKTYFSKIDNNAASAIVKLLDETNKDKKIGENIKKFICALFLRIPLIINGFAERAREQITERDASLQETTEFTLNIMEETVDYVYQNIFKNKDYFILNLNKHNKKFLTGDFPLHIDSNNEIILAISPNTAIYTDVLLVYKYGIDTIVNMYNARVWKESNTVLSHDLVFYYGEV